MSKKRYPPRIPRTAYGFRAQNLKNPPRGAWWAKRWIQAIESLRLGARSGRGKTYAECGQVIDLQATGPHVEARVLGSRPDPYTVKMDFAPAPVEALRKNTSWTDAFGAMTCGRILAGEMPLTVDEFFASHGISPYPSQETDRFWCSCPDWSKPCKHIAAVLYLLGDALIRDPSLLLRFRGISLDRGNGEGPRTEALPLWKGTIRLSDAVERIRRRAGMSS